MPAIIEALDAVEEGLRPQDGRAGALGILCKQPALVYETTVASIKDRLEALASVFQVCVLRVYCVWVMHFLCVRALGVCVLRVCFVCTCSRDVSCAAVGCCSELKPRRGVCGCRALDPCILRLALCLAARLVLHAVPAGCVCV